MWLLAECGTRLLAGVFNYWSSASFQAKHGRTGMKRRRVPTKLRSAAPSVLFTFLDGKNEFQFSCCCFHFFLSFFPLWGTNKGFRLAALASLFFQTPLRGRLTNAVIDFALACSYRLPTPFFQHINLSDMKWAKAHTHKPLLDVTPRFQCCPGVALYQRSRFTLLIIWCAHVLLGWMTHAN